MKLYNTLTRSTKELKPLNSPQVSVYTCGPTVYDYAHIGHWFTYIRWDLLIRTLRLSNLQPNWVMNITDVGHLVSDADEGEDKLEKGARREGKTAWEVAEFYTEDFLREMHLLNIQQPTHIPKATEHIAEQVALIQALEEKGYTYAIDDGIYYDTSKFPRYGDFARLDLDEQQPGARVEYNQQKHAPTDFALWKFSPKGQKRDMEWDSPWGIGFPGWHIECSAMSMKYLGNTLDIHTGGIDHIPVHHTNEIAQSEAVTEKPLATVWLHSNHVLIKNEKISKSLGNGIRLHDVIARGIDPEAFRLHVLESHYRSQSKFSWESLQAAQNRLKNWQATAVLRWQTVETTNDTSPVDFQDFKETLYGALHEDLNSPAALALVSGIFTKFDVTLVSKATQADFTDMLKTIDMALGLTLSDQPDISNDQKQLIADREEARKHKEWGMSDELRDKLANQGIGLRDTKHGVVWFRR